ncbi:MAG: hypothetical protein AB1762_10140 [Gemmatimonadota bacterium]
MRYARLLVLVACITSSASAQRPAAFRPELRPFVGAFIPTGGLRSDFKTATMLGGQAALELSDYAHIVGTLAWTHGHNKFTSLSDDVTYIWQYDLGVELNTIQQLNENWLFRPFLGAGAGARTYDYQAKAIGSQTCTAGYGALGMELQREMIAFRIEGREYLSCFESPLSAKKVTRNDIGLAFGLAYHLR